MKYEVKVGDINEVGEFFWISDFIGFDSNAEHGHGLNKTGGSVDVGCHVEVRGIEGESAIVSLRRPTVPFGAPAPIGSVFRIPVDQVASWREKLKAIKEREESCKILASKYCK